MHRSACVVPFVFLLALLVGCSDSDDDDGAGPSVAGEQVPDGPDLTPAPENDDPEPGTSPGEDDPAADDPMITFDAHERLLEEVFGIYSGEAWDTMPLSLAPGRFEGDVFEYTRTSTKWPDGSTASVYVANCRTGSGRLEAQIPNTRGNYSWQARLDACAPDPERTDLVLVSGSVDGDWSWHTSARSDDLAWITVSGERVHFDGEIRHEPSQFQRDRIAGFVTSNANQSVRDDVDGTLLRSIEEATSSRRIGSMSPMDTASLSGGFTYRSTGTGGRAVTVRMPVGLHYHWDLRFPAPDGVAPEDLGEVPLGDIQEENRTEEQGAAVERARERWAFTVGTLELQAEDGSGLMLDADTGDLDTVRITLDEGRGAGAEERIVDWPGSWYRALAPETLPSSRYEVAD